jgi:hypothetical protein
VYAEKLSRDYLNFKTLTSIALRVISTPTASAGSDQTTPLHSIFPVFLITNVLLLFQHVFDRTDFVDVQARSLFRQLYSTLCGF